MQLTDSSVSREHIEISVRPDGIMVEDLGSTNGTFYLGQKVERLVLRPGARITLGRCNVDVLPLEESDLDPLSHRQSYSELFGSSVKMQRLYAMLERIEGSVVPVLITGETGTGKELVARAIHQNSPRKEKPFIVVDCGNVEKELIGSELFGHRKGAYTGAHSDRAGAFETANGGTVFLDEIGELALELQPKLLRVLETGEIVRIGDTTPVASDVRIIAATHRNLSEWVSAGKFRNDLYYRLAVVRLFTPSLRDRREDIPELVEHLMKSIGTGDDKIPGAAMDFMVRYDWPGNVRELRNALHRLSVLGKLDVDDLGTSSASDSRQDIVADPEKLRYRDAKEVAIKAFETAYLKKVLELAEGNLSKAARVAGMDRKYLRELLRRHGLYRK